MGDVTRRAALAAGASAALAALSACATPVAVGDTTAPTGLAPRPTMPDAPPPIAVEAEPPPAVPPQGAPSIAKVPAPYGTIDRLPGEGSLLAWTVDDGTDAEVIAAYAAFAAATGIRLTMFVTGTYFAWDENVGTLAPLIASGQVQLANHTWSHPDLTTLGDASIADELQRTHDFIGEAFGVDARPYFRPPFGFHDERVDAVAAGLGYTVPTLWYGSLSDSAELPPETIVALANEWFLPQHIIIGHLNWKPVTTVFDQLRAIIVDRGLTTVTLNDVYSRDVHP